MQPTVKAAMLCDYALTSDDGKLSAIGIFSSINFNTLPDSYPRFFVVLILTLDAGTHALRLGIVDPLGEQMLPEPPQFELPVELPGADTNLVVNFNNLPFTRAGIFQVQLFVEDRLVHSMPLAVQAAAAEGAPPFRPN